MSIVLTITEDTFKKSAKTLKKRLEASLGEEKVGYQLALQSLSHAMYGMPWEALREKIPKNSVAAQSNVVQSTVNNGTDGFEDSVFVSVKINTPSGLFPTYPVEANFSSVKSIIDSVIENVLDGPLIGAGFDLDRPEGEIVFVRPARVKGLEVEIPPIPLNAEFADKHRDRILKTIESRSRELTSGVYFEVTPLYSDESYEEDGYIYYHIADSQQDIDRKVYDLVDSLLSEDTDKYDYINVTVDDDLVFSGSIEEFEMEFRDGIKEEVQECVGVFTWRASNPEYRTVQFNHSIKVKRNLEMLNEEFASELNQEIAKKIYLEGMGKIQDLADKQGAGIITFKYKDTEVEIPYTDGLRKLRMKAQKMDPESLERLQELFLGQ